MQAGTQGGEWRLRHGEEPQPDLGRRHAGALRPCARLTAEIDRADPSPATPGRQPSSCSRPVRLEHAPLAGTKLARLGDARPGARPCACPTDSPSPRRRSSVHVGERPVGARRAARRPARAPREPSPRLAGACHEVQRAASVARPCPPRSGPGILEAFNAWRRTRGLRGRPVECGGRGYAEPHTLASTTPCSAWTAGRLLDAYRAVLASTYSRAAVCYRFEHRLGCRGDC